MGLAFKGKQNHTNFWKSYKISTQTAEYNISWRRRKIVLTVDIWLYSFYIHFYYCLDLKNIRLSLFSIKLSNYIWPFHWAWYMGSSATCCCCCKAYHHQQLTSIKLINCWIMKRFSTRDGAMVRGYACDSRMNRSYQTWFDCCCSLQC